ncbi:MAG: hypothetical protein Q9201_007421 [Fulgogasparrea decipioides]
MPASKGKKRTSKAAAEGYESDGGFVANEDDSAPKSKKAKTAAPRKAPVKSAKADNEHEEEFWEITSTRRVNISEYKGQRMVNIREYYEDKSNGFMLPGKKGISLPIVQYATFLTLLPEIEKSLVAKGETVPRPDYKSSQLAAEDNAEEAEEGDDVEDAMENSKRKLQPHQKKQNFEATSDEEEEQVED